MRRTMPLLTLLLFACAAPPAERPDSVPPPVARGDSLTGVVRVVGSAPMNVRVVLAGEAGSTPLGGPLLGELRQLSGVSVSVRGRHEGGVLLAEDYRVLSVDGVAAVQGTVEGRSGPYVLLRTPDGALLHLIAAPDGFRPGQKVWVQGPDALVVQSYGTIGS